MDKLDDFRVLGLSESTLKALDEKGFETPTPIQALAIPALLNGDRDVIGQAQTGTGKTAAFGLPILERVQPGRGVQALVLVPTRELAIQVTEEMASFKGDKKLFIISIYGGQSISEQLRRLKKGVEVVVGTPGRVLDHLGRGSLVLDDLQYVILDEADEMLNMGFVDDIEEILQHAPEERRMLLFSATMPSRIAKLANRYMKEPELLKVESKQITADLTDQIYFELRDSDRFDALTRIIDVEPDFYGLVFCRTKNQVDEITSKLIERGYDSDGLHGDISQALREKVLRKFRNRHINVLVATDVAARGIDINDLTHVINYSLPQDPESYVHRIGRTGRAGKQGTAITFITPSEYRQFVAMQRNVNMKIRKEILPTANDVINIKKTRIKTSLEEIVENETYMEYLGMAEDIIAQNGPDIALAALLKLAFKDELDENSYSEIRTVSVDTKGKARLFIALGKLDGYNSKKIVELLKDKANIPDSMIDDVKVMDAFSFVTIPFKEAEHTLEILNAMRRGGGRPLAEIAGDSRGGGRGDRGGRGDYRGGGRDRDRAPRGERRSSDRGDRGGFGDRPRRDRDRDRDRPRRSR
ncbi:DEAD/DEAH box helicase [Alistipes sp. ZOR0009]|jgi:ATP-dependent RNA helicase DeaD|uniref:DEAD/DEAH box helicase n=1 Tax=Alistipes sp. ZOR0009 TaxID=1339253 RepID=UPI0009E0AF97|nr:DEAD/DEAH box helicase [Alistipes sp. ZOR0009]